jgi:hypothetical protein
MIENKLTIGYLHSIIKDKEFVKHTTPSGQILRWCVLTLDNGFAVFGDPSCCIDPQNDDENIGTTVAFDNAFKKLWQLEGYLRYLQLKENNQEVNNKEEFEEYLFNNLVNTCYFSLTVKNDIPIGDTEDIRFYIHPDQMSGETADFRIKGNKVIPDIA